MAVSSTGWSSTLTVRAPVSMRTCAGRTEFRPPGWRGLDAPQGGFDACHQFTRAEGFGDVIVRADGQADDFVGFFGAGGQQDDIHVRFAAQAGEQFDAVEAGQHDIEQDQVWFEGARSFQARFAVAGGQDFVAFGFQVGADKFENAGFVVDDKDFAHGWLYQGCLMGT
jgi:hypothetical protein